MDRPSVGDLLFEVHLILGWAHDGLAASGIDPQKLIGAGVGFEPNGLTHPDGHQGALQVSSSPRDGPVIAGVAGGRFDIEGIRAGAGVIECLGMATVEATKGGASPRGPL